MENNNQAMETERLILRPFKAEDGPGLHAYLSDSRVVEFEPYGPQSLEASRKEAVRRAGDSRFWAVCRRDTGRLIGNLYFSQGDFDTWELGCVFSAAHQKQGYATEACRALLDQGFRHGKVRRVIAHCNVKNGASWRLLERLGFRREGHFLQLNFFKLDLDGLPVWQDTYAYGILAPEWAPFNQTQTGA